MEAKFLSFFPWFIPRDSDDQDDDDDDDDGGDCLSSNILYVRRSSGIQIVWSPRRKLINAANVKKVILIDK